MTQTNFRQSIGKHHFWHIIFFSLRFFSILLRLCCVESSFFSSVHCSIMILLCHICLVFFAFCWPSSSHVFFLFSHFIFSILHTLRSPYGVWVAALHFFSASVDFNFKYYTRTLYGSDVKFIKTWTFRKEKKPKKNKVKQSKVYAFDIYSYYIGCIHTRQNRKNPLIQLVKMLFFEAHSNFENGIFCSSINTFNKLQRSPSVSHFFYTGYGYIHPNVQRPMMIVCMCVNPGGNLHMYWFKCRQIGSTQNQREKKNRHLSILCYMIIDCILCKRF